MRTEKQIRSKMQYDKKRYKVGMDYASPRYNIKGEIISKHGNGYMLVNCFEGKFIINPVTHSFKSLHWSENAFDRFNEYSEDIIRIKKEDVKHTYLMQFNSELNKLKLEIADDNRNIIYIRFTDYLLQIKEDSDKMNSQKSDFENSKKMPEIYKSIRKIIPKSYDIIKGQNKRGQYLQII